jgi:Cu-processing system permease protein
MLRVARRELRIVCRSRGVNTGLVLIAALAWLPAVLLPLRAGAFGVASFSVVMPLTIAAEGVVLPLLALLFGAEMLAGEVEDGSLLSVVTLPLSRTHCFLGKLLGRVTVLIVAEGVVFGLAMLAIASMRGREGLAGYAVVQGSAILLSTACVVIGAAIAAGGRGRLHAYAISLLTWGVLVFLIDALLLAAIVGLAPAAPTQVGEHGHSELSDSMPDRGDGSDGMPGGADTFPTGAWLLTLDPVDLFRLGALAAVPPAGPEQATWRSVGAALRLSAAPLTAGWLSWLTLPTLIGWWRFRRLPLR